MDIEKTLCQMNFDTADMVDNLEKMKDQEDGIEALIEQLGNVNWEINKLYTKIALRKYQKVTS